MRKLLATLFKNVVYTSRSGLTKGLKRRGGAGFLPSRKPLSREHEFYRALNLTGKTVYDVGGHVGLVTCFFARAVGEDGQVVTFEPNAENFWAIQDHVELNGFGDRVIVLQVGLGSEQGERKFVVADSSYGTASPEMSAKRLEQYPNAKTVTIFVDTLDNQIDDKDLPMPDFIKVDVEGMELDVLKGMAQTISRRKPSLFVELHGVNDVGVAGLLIDYGYSLYQVEDGIAIIRKNIEAAHGHVYAAR